MIQVLLTTRLRLATPYSPRKEGEEEYYPVKLVVGPSVKSVKESSSRVFWAEQVGRIEERDPGRQYRAKVSVGYDKIVVYLEWSDRYAILSKETGYVYEEGSGAEALGRLRRQVVDMTVNFPAPQTDEVSEDFEEFQRKANEYLEDRDEVSK